MTAIFTRETTPSRFPRLLASLLRSLPMPTFGRTEQLTIADLLQLDPSRLDDMGITAGDVREALKAPAKAGRHLAAKRAHRARTWTPSNLPA